jgi:hypothetical protein
MHLSNTLSSICSCPPFTSFKSSGLIWCIIILKKLKVAFQSVLDNAGNAGNFQQNITAGNFLILYTVSCKNFFINYLVFNYTFKWTNNKTTIRNHIQSLVKQALICRYI